MTTSQTPIDTQELSEYVKALKEYKNTGYKQSLSIIQTLKESELTPSQLNQIFPGAWLQTIQKIDPQDEDEQKLKNQMIDLLEGLNRRFREQTNNNLSKMKEQSREKFGKKNSSDSEKENQSQNQMNMNDSSSSKQKSELEEQKHTTNVSEEVKNFTVQSFATELVTDFKSNPAAKKDMKPIAVEKAKQLEEAVEEITEGDEDKFRIEARNVSSFLATKTNEELRQGILSGEIDPKEFLENKEEFLSHDIKVKVKEKEKEAINAGNLNRDVEIIPDNELYVCEKCGSRKIEHAEKQMKPASHSSHSILHCAECDHVEVKDP